MKVKWTTEKPTKDGWYFLRNPKGYVTMEIIQISPWGDHYVWFGQEDNEIEYSEMLYKKFMWFGPIELPKWELEDER